MQIKIALDRFLVQLEADGRSHHTLAQYRRHVNALALWADGADRGGEIEHIGHEALARFLVSPSAVDRADGGRKRPTSVNTLRTSVRCFFRYLHGAGYLAQDPSRLVRRALCEPPPPRALHEDEVENLLGVLKGSHATGAARDLALVTLLLGSGIRLGSALALDIEHLDLDHCELQLNSTKGRRRDRLAIDQTVADCLRALVADRTSGPVFLSGQGQRLSARHFQRRLAQYAKRAGLRHVSPHALRHTRATRLYRQTRDLLLVKEALRHRSIMSTVRYVRA